MALNKTALKQGILSLMKDMAERTEDPEQAQEDFATGLSDLIDAYTRSATVVVNAGQAVQVVIASGTGSTVAPGSGSLT